MVRLIAAFLSFTLAVSVVTAVPNVAYAQEAAEKAELSGTRKQLATIVFAGLAGAILGLSTLSFYGRPQDHLSNIAIGFAIGVIGGAIFTTYRVATKPYDAYDIGQIEKFQNDTQLENQLRFQDETFKREMNVSSTQYNPTIGWRWSF